MWYGFGYIVWNKVYNIILRWIICSIYEPRTIRLDDCYEVRKQAWKIHILLLHMFSGHNSIDKPNRGYKILV